MKEHKGQAAPDSLDLIKPLLDYGFAARPKGDGKGGRKGVYV